MKELSIEEKAKAYDKAIKVAKSKIKNDKDHVLYEDDVIDIFPELKESEDERIKACIKICLTNIDEQRFADFNTTLKECHDWLEKQGEHAEFRDSIQIGDEVTRNEDGVLVNLTQLKRVAKQEKLTEFEKAVKQVMEEAIECGDTHNLKADADMLLSLAHKPAWSEKDKTVLDALIRRLEGEDIYVSPHLAAECIKSLKERVQPQHKQGWNEEDEKILSDIIKDLVHPWNEYIPDRIEDEIKWLKNRLKPLKDRVQPNQEWSEEDEYCRHQLIVFCENCMVKDEGAKKCANWLKSLKQRYTWKPSDEQMKVLDEVIKNPHLSSTEYNTLTEIEEQLEKLKDEK